MTALPDLDDLSNAELDALTLELDQRGRMLPLIDLEALANVRPKPREFALAKFIPMHEVTLFNGPKGAGKSLFGQQLCTCYAVGVPFLGIDAMHGPALYVSAEDGVDELHRRQLDIARRLGVPLFHPNLHLCSIRGRLNNELCTFDREGRLDPSDAFKLLRETIMATEAKFVVLDNLGHLFAGNENDRGQVTQFCNLLYSLGNETGATIVLIAHPNKAGDSYSGSTAWINAVRSQIVLDWQRDGEGNIIDLDARELKLVEANYARKGEALPLRWHDFALVREEDLPGNWREEMAATAQAAGDNDVFLACLAKRTKQRRAVSERVGANYAPAVFARMADGRKIGQRRLTEAMERLYEIEAIERAELWRDDYRHPVFGLRETARETARQTLAGNAGNPPDKSADNPLPYTYGIKGARPARAAAPLPDDDADPFGRPDPFGDGR